MTDASNPLENRISQTRRVSVLVSLDLPPNCEANDWPAHIIFDTGNYPCAMWGLLDGWIKDGSASGAGDKPIVLLNVAEEDAEWLPKVSELSSLGSNLVMAMLRECWFGKEDGTHLEPLGQTCLQQVSGKTVGYELRSLHNFHWAIVTIREPSGSVVQLQIPSYQDQATIKQHCENAVEWGEVFATGRRYESGAGEVFLVEQWSSLKDL